MNPITPAPTGLRLSQGALLVAAIFGTTHAFAQAPQAQAANVPTVAASSPARAASGVAQSEYKESEVGNPQSMPMSKAVVSGAALQQSSQDGYAEAVRNVAGVSPANSKGSANDSINIRGIKLNLFSNYRLDGGLPITGVMTVPVEDKLRIETLKGANALLFGVASPAGVINLVTKRAGDVDNASVAAAGNSFGQSGASIDLGKRLGNDRELGVRVNASLTHLNNGVVPGDGQFASAGVDYRFTSHLTLQGDFEYYSKQVEQQAGISLLAAVKGVIPITPVPDPRRLLSGKWALLDAHTENSQIRLDYAFNDDWKVLAEAGRSNSDRSNFTTRIGGYDIVTGAGGVVTVNTATQQYANTFARIETLGRFTTWSLHHDLAIGVSRTERDADTLAQNQTTLTQKQNIFDPIELAAPVFKKAPTSQDQTSKDNDLYTYDTIGVGSDLRLLAGVRRLKDIETGTSETTTYVTSPAFGLLYDIIPHVTVFGSSMQGLEAGGTAPATAVNVNQILPSAISRQKELGLRATNIPGLSFSTSVFEITRANAVTDPVTKIFANDGDIKYRGLEATLSWQFMPRWQVYSGAQLLHAKQVSPDPTFNGFAPENTPKFVGNVALEYRPEFLQGLALTGSVSDISKRFVNNQQQATIPGYQLYGLGAGYVTRVDGHRVSLQFNIDNLTNLRYWNSVQTGTYGTGMDRSFKFSGRFDF